MEIKNFSNVKLRAFEYNSRQEYEQSNKSSDFWVVLGIPTTIIFLITTLGLGRNILLLNDVTMTLGVGLTMICTLLVIASVIWLISSLYDVDDFMEECKERYKMWKYKKYHPIEASTLSKLNSVVQLKNGEMYRKYQFINAEKSDSKYITLQLPREDMTVWQTIKGRPTNENMCMFKKLSEVEMADILIPIQQYHEDNKYRAELERKEEEIKQQSEINSQVTSEDIKGLPLFKSMKTIADKTAQDVNKYNKEMQSNLKENKNIVKGMKSSKAVEGSTRKY